MSSLVNPDQATLNLPVGTVSAAVALAGTTAPVIGPADVPIEDGKLTIVYAWGSAEDANLALAVQSITVGHSTPGGAQLRHRRLRRRARRDEPGVRRSSASRSPPPRHPSRSSWSAARVP